MHAHARGCNAVLRAPWRTRTARITTHITRQNQRPPAGERKKARRTRCGEQQMDGQLRPPINGKRGARWHARVWRRRLGNTRSALLDASTLRVAYERLLDARGVARGCIAASPALELLYYLPSLTTRTHCTSFAAFTARRTRLRACYARRASLGGISTKD